MPTIIIDYDQDPDFSCLEQDHYKPGHKDYSPIYHTEEDMKAGRDPIDPDWYTDPDNHVALEMLLYDDEGRIIDSLGGIDFLRDSDDWCTGNYSSVGHIPARCPYLRALAADMMAELDRQEAEKRAKILQDYLDVL